MKFKFLPILLVGSLLYSACAIENRLYTVLEAQALPLDVKVQWNPSVVDTLHGAPTGYKVTYDGVVKDELLPALNVACSCLQVIRTITNPGMHTFSVVAYNEWGDSIPTVANVLVNVPNTVSNLKVTK